MSETSGDSKGFVGFLNRWARVCLAINMVVAVAMMLVVSYGVAARYLFNVPSPWVPEVSEFMTVSLVFLALAYAQGQRKHVAIGVVFDKLSPRAKVIATLFNDILSLGLFVVLAWASWRFAYNALQAGFLSDAARIPLFPPRLLVPIGCLFMVVQLVADIVKGFGSISRPNSLKTGAAGEG